MSLFGCERQAGSKPLVLVTVAPQAWLVEQLAGDFVEVAALVPPGAHPGSYAPGHAAMERINRARLYLNLGTAFPFEGVWLHRIQDLNPGLRTAAVPAMSSDHDAHIWTSFRGIRALADTARAALVLMLPEQADAVRANHGALLGLIEAKEQAFREALVGREGHRFYVFHPAWTLLAREFSLEQVAIEDHGKEPSASRLADLVRRAREDGITYLLAQPQFSQQGARAIADAVDAEVLFVDPLLEDWGRAMDELLEALQLALVEGTSS